MGSDKCSTELINVTGVLTLIRQENVFRHAPNIVAMTVEVRALIGPVSVIEHERVHRDHYAELGSAMLLSCPRAIRPIKKCNGVIVEFRPARAVGLLVPFD